MYSFQWIAMLSIGTISYPRIIKAFTIVDFIATSCLPSTPKKPQPNHIHLFPELAERHLLVIVLVENLGRG
jgi:hypothetical protein